MPTGEACARHCARAVSRRRVLAFWLAYILTRPLGASIGDGLSQTRHNGGLGLGTTNTSYVFLACIVALVAVLTATRKDQTAPQTVLDGREGGKPRSHGFEAPRELSRQEA